MRQLIFLLLATTAIVLPAVAQAVPGPESLAADRFSADLRAIRATYGQETWKYDAGYIGQQPSANTAGHALNQTSSYYGSVGLRVTLEIQVCKTDGTDKCSVGAEANLDSTNYVPSASIATSRGPIYAYVKPAPAASSPTPTTPSATPWRWILDFDMDGDDYSGPAGGAASPPADAGVQDVTIKISTNVLGAPSTVQVGETHLSFGYERPSVSGLLQGIAYNPIQEVPDTTFRLFNDIGWDLAVPFVTRQMNLSSVLDLDFQFTANAWNTGKGVDLYGLIAQKGVAVPAAGTPVPAPTPGLPFIPGVSDNATTGGAGGSIDRSIVMTSKLLQSNTTDATGRAHFRITGAQLVGVLDQNTLSRALVVLAPVMASVPVDAQNCPADCRGGAQFRVGSSSLVATTSDRHVSIESMQLDGLGLNGAQLPAGGPREAALAVNGITLLARDREGFYHGTSSAPETRSGDVWALVPDVQNSKPLSAGSLAPTQRANENLLSGTFTVKPIQDQHITYYRVVVLLYADSDAFYGLAAADRGYTVAVSNPTVQIPTGTGEVKVEFTSRTTDHALPADDPGFGLRVAYQIAIPSANQNVTGTVDLKEGAVVSKILTVTAQTPSVYEVRVSSTSGDVLPPDTVGQVLFKNATPSKGVKQRIPGFELVLATAAMAAAMLAMGRRAFAR